MMTKVSARCSAPSKREGDEEGEREAQGDGGERQERKEAMGSEKERASRARPWSEGETRILRLHYKS